MSFTAPISKIPLRSRQATLRPATVADDAFLQVVYRSTREREMEPLAWSERQKAAFCDMQFTAQTLGYRNSYPDARHFIVCAPGGEAAGRLITARRGTDLLLVDIALLPRFRSRGWGTSLLRSLQEEAAGEGAALRLSVEMNNPALALYRRLGFEIAAASGIRYEMVWRPNLQQLQLKEGDCDVRSVSW